MIKQWSTAMPARSPAATRKVFTLKPGVGGVEFKLLSRPDRRTQGSSPA
jgi:hypothetical protein